MSEIKFKAKKHDGSWVYGNLITMPDGKQYVVKNNYFYLDGHHLSCDSDEPVFIVQGTVCQFRKLKDKNGFDIYDGDKLDNSLYGPCIVVNGDICETLSVLYSSSVIIGNIHDEEE